jgi:hypothetical protein
MGRFLPNDEAGAAESAGETPEVQPEGPKGDAKQTLEISDTVAPSVAPHTTFTRPAHEPGAVDHRGSEVDAIGLDKRREVVGKSYGPSVARRATMYGIFLAALTALVIGGKLLADELDQPPAEVKAEAPWTGTDAPPAPIDSRPAGNIPTEGP